MAASLFLVLQQFPLMQGQAVRPMALSCLIFAPAFGRRNDRSDRQFLSIKPVKS
jgi:hypothetical protein